MGHGIDLTLRTRSLKIAIEPDGPHHLDPVVAARDRKRDFDLGIEGWLVVHIDLAMGPGEAISRIRQAFLLRSNAS